MNKLCSGPCLLYPYPRGAKECQILLRSLSSGAKCTVSSTRSSASGRSWDTCERIGYRNQKSNPRKAADYPFKKKSQTCYDSLNRSLRTVFCRCTAGISSRQKQRIDCAQKHKQPHHPHPLSSRLHRLLRTKGKRSRAASDFEPSEDQAAGFGAVC